VDPGRIVRADRALTGLALDTNILAYAEGVVRDRADHRKVRRALELIGAIRQRSTRPFVALQTFAELHQVLVRKHQLDRSEAQSRVEAWCAFAHPVPTGETVFNAALELASDHQLQIYDAIILAAAAQAQCDLLLSEDLQDGFAWRGVTVANPFADKLEPRLARLLA
jgi:predicted nucleic acid-binding protein